MPTGKTSIDLPASLCMGALAAVFIGAAAAALGSWNLGLVYSPIVRGLIGFGAMFIVFRVTERAAGFSSPILSWSAWLFTVIAVSVGMLIAVATTNTAPPNNPPPQLPSIILLALLILAGPVAIGAFIYKWIWAN